MIVKKMLLVSAVLCLTMGMTIFGVLATSDNPEPPSLASPKPPVDIIKPTDGGNVSWRDAVEGTYTIPENGDADTNESELMVYVLVWPVDNGGPWWVQPTNTYYEKGRWESIAWFGEKELYSETYKIIALLVNQELQSGDQYWVLPNYVAKSSEIEVHRIP